MSRISTSHDFRLPKASSNTFLAFSTPTLAYGTASNQIVSLVQSLVLSAPENDRAILRTMFSTENFATMDTYKVEFTQF